jgi:hypothetical protein
MKALVIGGHTRNIGKTGVMAALIRGLKFLNWTAVKITQYGHGICSLDGKPCGCVPTEHAFVLTEEVDFHGRADTCRYLAAGAKRSLWLRVRQGQLGEAFPLLERAVSADACVMIESNSVLGLLRPVLYLLVLDSLRHDFKPSARQFLEQADALVPIESRFDARAWPGLDTHVLVNKPVFPVPAREYFSLELCRFVEQRFVYPAMNSDALS